MTVLTRSATVTPLDDPDAELAADAATIRALLRCWTRETGVDTPDDVLRLPLRRSGVTVEVPVRHRSPIGAHRYGVPTLAGQAGHSVSAVLLTALLGHEAGAAPTRVADVVERCAESRRRIAGFLAARRADPRTAVGPFLAAEQALLLGHLGHPAAKSRDGISDADAAAWSPELRGAFPLHWFAVRREVVAGESLRHSPALDGADLPSVLARLAGRPAPDGCVLVPAHPWQARDLPTRPGIGGLVDAGLVTPLGPLGPPWHPTSSLRTVYRPDAPVKLKLSLGLRVTNSRRENTRTELRRGVEVHRLLDAGLADELARVHPSFGIVPDPAWLAVHTPDDPDGLVPTHLDVSVRAVPFTADAPVACLAGLLAPQPGIGPSRLGVIVQRLATATGRHTADVAVEWLRRHLETVLAPMVWLYAVHGIGLEAHQQNTLVRLDRDGWPAGGWFRDNQGYYLAESALPRVLTRLDAPASTLALCPDLIVDDRLTYYLLHNHVLGLVEALADGGALADETDLLRVVRAGVAAMAGRYDSPGGMLRRWLDADTLPCKANLATQLAGIDEVLAPVDAQSVYVQVPNPLRDLP